MAVNRDYRRMGVAKQLLSGCETLAFRWGFDYLWLHVDVGNDVAESLYKSQGWVSIDLCFDVKVYAYAACCK